MDPKQTEQEQQTTTKPQGDLIRFKCDECGFAFRDHVALQEHLRSRNCDKLIMLRQKIYKCGECGMEFNKRPTVMEHMRKHTGEKPYKCQVCGAAFAYECSLQFHERLHPQEVLRVGGTSFVFTQGNNSQEHIHFKIHEQGFDVAAPELTATSTVEETHFEIRMLTQPGETPLKCVDDGSAEFTDVRTLQVLDGEHVGQNLVVCDMCNVAFKHKYLLKRHIIHAHGVSGPFN